MNDEPPAPFGARVAKGPMVSRRAKVGGAILVVGSVQFVLAMAVTQYHFPGYSVLANTVSDLGNPDISPWAWLINGSIQVLGVLGVVAAVLLFSAFRPRWTSRIGLISLMLASVGAFAVGTFPETSPQLGGHVHTVFSLVAFLFSGIALLTLGLAMLRDTRWDGYRLYTLVSGLVTVVALALYAANVYPLLGPGGMERLIIFPILIWAVVAGVHLLRMKTYVPSTRLESAGAQPSG